MRFAIYSEVGEQSIRENLGRPEYSYYFVLKSFLPALERIGTVEYVRDPATDLDPIFAECAARNEPCLFVSFSPPHKAFIGHDHPMIVVFAWEFATIPNEVWDDDPRNDWRTVFARNGRAVTLSGYTARVTKAAMGADFPVLAVSGTVWDRFAPMRATAHGNPIIGATELRLEGLILDNRELDLSPDYLLNPEPPIPEPPQPEAPPCEAAPDEAEAIKEPVVPETMVTPEAESDAPMAMPEPPPVEPEPKTQSTIALVEEPPVTPSDPFARKSVRYRLGITKHHALEWYREAIRDLLPRWLIWLMSRIGRLTYKALRLFLRSPASTASVVEAPEPPEVLELPQPITPEPVAVDAAEEAVQSESEPEPEPLEIAEPPADPEIIEAASAAPPPPPVAKWPEGRVTVSGVVYTSVLNPTDGRKNYKDLITAFCWAFRDVEDATLVLKMVQGNLARWFHPYMQMLSQMSPFKCRVVALQGYLEEEEYRKLIDATTYYVNASCCEGLCLPLMEFMSCRRPAVAPGHTAMEDYIDPSNAFLVAASLEHNVWPHDPRDLFRTERYRIDWESLLNAYRESYRVAKEQPDLYAKMGESASQSMRAISSDEIVAERLERFLDLTMHKRPAMEVRYPVAEEVMAE